MNKTETVDGSRNSHSYIGAVRQSSRQCQSQPLIPTYIISAFPRGNSVGKVIAMYPSVMSSLIGLHLEWAIGLGCFHAQELPGHCFRQFQVPLRLYAAQAISQSPHPQFVWEIRSTGHWYSKVISNLCCISKSDGGRGDSNSLSDELTKGVGVAGLRSRMLLWHSLQTTCNLPAVSIKPRIGLRGI